MPPKHITNQDNYTGYRNPSSDNSSDVFDNKIKNSTVSAARENHRLKMDISTFAKIACLVVPVSVALAFRTSQPQPIESQVSKTQDIFNTAAMVENKTVKHPLINVQNFLTIVKSKESSHSEGNKKIGRLNTSEIAEITGFKLQKTDPETGISIGFKDGIFCEARQSGNSLVIRTSQKLIDLMYPLNSRSQEGDSEIVASFLPNGELLVIQTEIVNGAIVTNILK
jgi:hypothetical protein